MPRIQVLPTVLKNKIAAGEVVERPASVVKELLENSIDAGSTVVSVEVEKGGRKLIRVSDNGSGMDAEDAVLSLKRHATSKLASEEDLFRIKTMGFRGEALPSIASISRLTLTTALQGKGPGVKVEAEGGEVARVREVPSVGTAVEVRDLFFNTPARKKFLKRDATELMHVVDIVTRIALSHPPIAFSLRTEGKETMNLPRASGFRERLAQVYGSEFMDGLTEARMDVEGLGIEAFVSSPGNFRDARSHQLLFINGRTVRDPSVSHAVYAAYEGTLPREKHPIFVVFLRVDPSLVDFNVHPTKREVRFSDRDTVYRYVKRCIGDAIRARPPEDRGTAAFSADASRIYGGADAALERGSYTQERPEPSGIGEPLSLSYRAELPYIYLGETFVALADGGGLTLLDHHAAHERVLYERLLKGVELNSRQLLFPRQVKLSHGEYLAVLEHREMLFGFGLEVEDFGHDTVVVRSLPEALEEADFRGVLGDAAAEMRLGERPGRSLREGVAARMACHNSVRGTKVLGREALAALLSDLERTDDPEHCPHGRPTRVRYSIEGLRKLFKRK